MLRRAVQNSNRLIGIIMLILLLVLIGPNTLPRLLTRTIPVADEGVSCASLPSSINRGNHQSLIGRLAGDPLSVVTRADWSGSELVVRVTMINNSIGTIPIIYNPQEVLVGDNQTTGMGIIFNPPVNLTNNATRQDPATGSFDENNIRLLGPRQRCIHRVEFTAEQVAAAPNVQSGQVQVSSYYRVTTSGQVIQTDLTVTPVYLDQGIRVQGGFIQSPAVTIPSNLQAN